MSASFVVEIFIVSFMLLMSVKNQNICLLFLFFSPLISSEKKILKTLLVTTTSVSKSENHFLEIGRAKLRREAKGMDSLRCLANPLAAP